MLDYCLDISDNSKWVICTKPDIARTLPFYITEAGEFFAGGRYYTERDGRSGWQLIYTVSGAGRLTADGNEIALLPNTAVILRCGERHRYETVKPPWHNLWIHFDGSGAGGYERLINDDKYHAIPVANTGDFESDFINLLNLSSKNDLLTGALISDCISRLMTELLTQKLRQALRPEGTDGRYPELRAVLDFIHKNYGRAITIEDMTDRINISKYHFIRIFKKQMGVTPYEYLTDYRINKAKILLRTSYKSVFEIACDVGYKSKSNFISKFRAATGTTPAKYGRENISVSSSD